MILVFTLSVGLIIVASLVAVFLIARGVVLPFWRVAEPWREHLSAEHRARSLLREILTTDEYQLLMRTGYLEVHSPNYDHRVYRVPGAGGLVKVYDRGCAVMELCLQPVDPLPDSDIVVMHKLMITANEQLYLERANKFSPGIISTRYRAL